MVCAWMAAEAPAAWATAQAWPARPARLVVCCGGVNGLNVAADADASA